MLEPRQKYLRLCQINCENLFVHMDRWQNQPLNNLNEKEWQALSSSSTDNKPLQKVRWLAEALLDTCADIILLCEVGGRESLENFNRHFLGDQFEVQIIEGNSDRGIDVAYLLRKGLPFRFDLISHRHRPLHFLYPHEIELKAYWAEKDPSKITKQSHLFSRDVLELRLFRENSPHPVLIFLNVHLKSKLDSQRIDHEGRLRREAELKALVQIYNELRRDFHQVPMIVAGDFNGHARRESCAPEFASLHTDTDLVEMFGHLKRPPTETATQLQFTRSRPPQLLQIDYIFISPELKDRLVESECRVYLYKSDLKVTIPYAQSLEQRNALPSDHYPVTAALVGFFE